MFSAYGGGCVYVVYPQGRFWFWRTASIALAMSSHASDAIMRYCIDWRCRECCFHIIRWVWATSSAVSSEAFNTDLLIDTDDDDDDDDDDACCCCGGVIQAKQGESKTTTRKMKRGSTRWGVIIEVVKWRGRSRMQGLKASVVQY